MVRPEQRYRPLLVVRLDETKKAGPKDGAGLLTR